MAQVGLAMLHYRRGEHYAAIKLYETVLEAVEADSIHDEEFKTLHGRYRAHYDLGGCYAAISDQIDKGLTWETFALDTKAIEHKRLAPSSISRQTTSLLHNVSTITIVSRSGIQPKTMNKTRSMRTCR